VRINGGDSRRVPGKRSDRFASPPGHFSSFPARLL
jgi:hypothetical protein